MTSVAAILSESLDATFKNQGVDGFAPSDDTNLLENVDSFTIVDLLLETEGRLEAAFGRYVPLADETIFDADKSPLKKWSDWVKFVENRLAE